jgi:cytochrome c553
VSVDSGSARGSVIGRSRAALGLLASCLSSVSQAQIRPQATNVPDVITRESGLRVVPMPRAAQTYATNCQGCHGELGSSAPEIPTLAGRVGYFTRLPDGRRYLVQVPNVALNPSSNEDIAAVLNWILLTYSRAQLAPDFQPYTAGEISELRKARIDVVAERRRIVTELASSKQIASAEVLALSRIAPTLQAASPDAVTLGREKYAPCASCHGSDGRSTVVPQYPKIGGQSGPYVVNALKAYRDGRRLGTFAALMTEVAKPLSDADIENLAAYIETLDTRK